MADMTLNVDQVLRLAELGRLDELLAIPGAAHGVAEMMITEVVRLRTENAALHAKVNGGINHGQP